MDGFFPKDADFLCKGKSWARVWKKRRGLLKALKASESFAKRKAVNSGRRLAWLAASQWNSELFVQTGNPTKAVGPMQRPRLLLKSLMQRNLENQFEKEGGGGKENVVLFCHLVFFLCLPYFCLIPKLYVDDWRWYVLYKYADGPKTVPWNALRLASAPEKETKKAKWETKRVLERCSRLH